MSSATKYIITISKKLEYLSSVIDKKNKLRDLFSKAKEDIVENIISLKSLDDGFTMTLDSEAPYLNKSILTSEETLQRKVGNVNLDYYIREFVNQDMAEKFGELDPKVNPHLFDLYPEEIYDNNGKFVKSIDTYLYNEELSKYWETRYQRYVTIIKTKGI